MKVALIAHHHTGGRRSLAVAQRVGELLAYIGALDSPTRSETLKIEEGNPK